MLKLYSKNRKEFKRRRIMMHRLLNIRELKTKRNLRHNKKLKEKERRRSVKFRD